MIEGSELGQFVAASLYHPARARADFPEVANHIADGCPLCEQDLQQLLDWLRVERAEPGQHRELSARALSVTQYSVIASDRPRRRANAESPVPRPSTRYRSASGRQTAFPSATVAG
jgi:hypothetical protein